MYSLLLIGILAFCVAFVLTPLCRNLAIRWGLVDQPDHFRKFHTRPIPRSGVPLLNIPEQGSRV
jgi:UDP-GlcNAc:undecaprenyl-phosphate GlcNAc-1-phosphate transferase